MCHQTDEQIQEHADAHDREEAELAAKRAARRSANLRKLAAAAAAFVRTFEALAEARANHAVALTALNHGLGRFDFETDAPSFPLVTGGHVLRIEESGEIVAETCYVCGPMDEGAVPFRSVPVGRGFTFDGNDFRKLDETCAAHDPTEAHAPFKPSTVVEMHSDPSRRC